MADSLLNELAAITPLPTDIVPVARGANDLSKATILQMIESVFPRDVSGNFLINFIPTTGNEAALLALTGTAGQIAVATDTGALVLYNGVANGAKAVRPLIGQPGTQAALLALTGVAGQIAVATDTKALVVYNGVANGAVAIPSTGGGGSSDTLKVTLNSYATVIDATNYTKVIVKIAAGMAAFSVTNTVKIKLAAASDFNKLDIQIHLADKAANLGAKAYVELIGADIDVTNETFFVLQETYELFEANIGITTLVLKDTGFFSHFETTIYYDSNWASFTNFDLNKFSRAVSTIPSDLSGLVGEILTTTAANSTGNAITLISNTLGTANSLSLPTGLWEVTSSYYLTATGSDVTVTDIVARTISNQATDMNYTTNYLEADYPGGMTIQNTKIRSIVSRTKLINNNTQQTFWNTFKATYTGGTLKVFGVLTARRVL